MKIFILSILQFMIQATSLIKLVTMFFLGSSNINLNLLVSSVEVLITAFLVYGSFYRWKNSSSDFETQSRLVLGGNLILLPFSFVTAIGILFSGITF